MILWSSGDPSPFRRFAWRSVTSFSKCWRKTPISFSLARCHHGNELLISWTSGNDGANWGTSPRSLSSWKYSFLSRKLQLFTPTKTRILAVEIVFSTNPWDSECKNGQSNHMATMEQWYVVFSIHKRGTSHDGMIVCWWDLKKEARQLDSSKRRSFKVQKRCRGMKWL